MAKSKKKPDNLSKSSKNTGYADEVTRRKIARMILRGRIFAYMAQKNSRG